MNRRSTELNSCLIYCVKCSPGGRIPADIGVGGSLVEGQLCGVGGTGRVLTLDHTENVVDSLVVKPIETFHKMRGTSDTIGWELWACCKFFWM